MSSFFSRFLSLSIFLFCYHYGIAQDRYSLKITAEAGKESVVRKFKPNLDFADSLSLMNEVREYVQGLHQEGYLLAYLKRIEFEKGLATAALNIGEQFDWLALSPGNIDPKLIKRVGFREKMFQGKPFRYRQISDFERRILSNAEQTGYPFASLRLDSLSIEGDHFRATLNLETGPPIVFDSVNIQGSTQTKSKFIGRYLGINMGEPYDQTKVDNIARALNNLPYLRLTSNPILSFQNSEASIVLNLTNRRINQIDGIIGFLPNSSADNGLVVTGQLDVELYSPLGSGRHLGIHWQKLNVNSQNLVMDFEQPNIFMGPLDLDLDFNFLKEDTLFTSRNFRLEFDYRLNASSSFSAFTNFKKTNLLATSIYAGIATLPDLVDFDYTSYGLRLEWQKLDDIFLPKRGARLWLEGSAGNKRIIQNNGIADELYLGVPLKSFQYELNLTGEKYWALGNQLVLVNRLKAGKVFNDRLFRNDAYRLGGFNSIRGFNENFFYATSYSFLTAEARFFLDDSSYLSAFGDFAWLQSKFDNVNETQTPFGLGAGISFSTNAGIFNFVYALGSADDEKGFNLAQSKIHFGYVSRF